MAKKTKKFQPIIRDDNNSIRRRYIKLSSALGMQRQTVAQRIFEEGLTAIERQLAQTGE